MAGPSDRAAPAVAAAMHPDFRADINGLRGLSVVMVVAYHLNLRGTGGGYVGVDIFFVISGFLMTRLVWDGLAGMGFGYLRYLEGRFLRIVPALAAMMGLLLGAGAVLLPPFDLRILGEQALWAAGFASNEFFRATSGYNTQGAGTHWLLHTWSVSVEWQFYLLYPLLLWALLIGLRRLAPTLGTDGHRRGALAVLALLAVASLVFQSVQRHADPDASFFLLPGRAWELLAGGVVWLALPARRPAPGRQRVVASYAGLAIVLLAPLVLGYFRLRPVGLGPWLLPALAGVALILWADHRENALLRNPWLQQLGTCSYSLYLWHWPIIVAVGLSGLAIDHPRLALAVMVLASLAAGWCSYRWVERPMLQRRWPRPRGVVYPAVGLALAALGAIGVVLSEGMAWRDREGHEAYRAHRDSVAPLYFPERCSNFRMPVAAMTVCPIEKAPGRRILVIGDSHAEHLYAWFLARSEVSADFFAASECPPVPRFERMQPGYDCAGYAARAWDMARSPAYDTVLVSARWATVGLAGPPYCHRQADGACEFPVGAAKQERIRTELQAAIEATLAAGKTVLMLDSAPEARVRVPEHVARERHWYGSVRYTIPLQSLIEQTQWMEPLLHSLEGRDGFHRLSLRDRLCTGSTCRVVDAELKRPIYIDDSHFDPVWIAHNADIFTVHALRRVRP